METPSNSQDQILKKLIKETPLERPSLAFSAKVMQQIESPKALKAYSPLISKMAWGAIVTVFMVGLVWVYYHPSSSLYQVEALSYTEKLSFRNPFEGFALSKTTLYAIGFMALFLLQIPFLKRIVEPK